MSLASKLGLMNKFKSIVTGIADSLSISKQLLKERQKEKKKFSIEALTMDFLPGESIKSLHNVVSDVDLLKKLLMKIGVTEEIIKTHTKSINQMVQDTNNKNREATAKFSLQEYSNKISKNMISKMAKTGITKHMLLHTYQKSGFDGVRILLGENINGKPRVTTNKKVLHKICSLF